MIIGTIFAGILFSICVFGILYSLYKVAKELQESNESDKHELKWKELDRLVNNYEQLKKEFEVFEEKYKEFIKKTNIINY